MKKLLFIIGLGGIGYGLYNYFTKQLALALDWDFKIKDFKVNSITSQGADLNLIISVLNKSAFAIEVKDYDIDVFYKGVKIGNAVTNTPFIIQGDSWFDVPTKAYIGFQGAKGILGDFGMAVIKKEPIKLDVKGGMNVIFGKIPKEVEFNVKDVVVTENITETIGLSKPLGDVTDWLGKLGIKI